MKLLMVVADLGALLLIGWPVRALLRWSDVSGRPVLTCAEFAEAEPGTPVVLVGRSAAEPVLTAPRSRKPCAGYQHVRIWNPGTDYNPRESTTDVGDEQGDTMLHGADGSRVSVARRVRTDPLFMGVPMMVIGDRHEDSMTRDQRIEQEWIIPPDRPVVAAGVVVAEADDGSGRLFLDWRDGADGSLQGNVEDLPRRFAGDFALASTTALIVAGLVVLITYLTIR